MKVINWIKENKILMLLIIGSSTLRLYKLDVQSPWGDELFTLLSTGYEKSFGDIFTILKSDVHPPLYYYLIHFFNLFFENTSFLARFISAFFGIAGLFSVYYLSKELLNNKVGLIAVALLSINYFHIYYSQEARMYSMLFFTTTISFIYLVKFIKVPSIKSALFHSVFASILIYTHFFALFTLFSQYLILLFFVYKPFQTTNTKMFLYSLLSGFVTLILYIPALIIFFQASERTSFWIPSPERDVYTAMFKEFLGFSEIAIFISLISVLFFFIKLFERKEINKYEINPIQEKQIFCFFILFIWIIVTLFIPFLISYIKLPMIISRYFINVLPAIIIIIASGISYMKNNLVKVLLIFSFLAFSFVDLIEVKGFYKSIYKTQYREVSEYVIKNHKNNEKIISSFEYYFSYYLKKQDKHEVEKSNINEYINNVISKNEKPQSFWYVDIGSIPDSDKPNDKTKSIIDSLYVVDENINLLDAFAKHYVEKTVYKPNINLTKFKPFKDRNGDNINLSVEIFTEDKNKIDLSGWAYLMDQTALDSKIYLFLINNDTEILINTENINREDVTTYFKSPFDISNSGFKTTVLKKNLQNGSYNLAICIVDRKNKKEAFVITDKKFNVNN
jgi:hypothetical protein